MPFDQQLFIHTSVTSVLKTDCRKKRGSCLLNLWCDNKLNEKSQHWKRRRELSKDAALNASRLHSWMDSCQCSNLSLQRIYICSEHWRMMDETTNPLCWWCAAHPPLFSGKKRCSYQYQSRFNRKACSRLADKSPKHGAIFWYFTSRVKKSCQMNVKMFLSRDVVFSAKKNKNKTSR